MKLLLSLSVLLSALGFSGCKEPAEEAVPLSPTIAAQINRIQEEKGLTDAEVSAALERWVTMYTIAGDVLESEEAFGSGAWTPERFTQLMVDSEQAMKAVHHEDQMLAVYSLGHLAALNEERNEDVAKSLRRIIVKHYASMEDSPDETGENFINKVQELAKTDPELERLLNETKNGEQDVGLDAE